MHDPPKTRFSDCEMGMVPVLPAIHISLAHTS